jgi:hypothetical protein
MDLQNLQSMKDQDQRAATGHLVILLHILFHREGVSVRAVDDPRTLLMAPLMLAKLKQMFR